MRILKRHFFSCEWMGKTVARVYTSPVINGTCSGFGIVFTDGCTLQCSDGGSGELMWLTVPPSAPKRVPLARKVLVRGRKTRPAKGQPRG